MKSELTSARSILSLSALRHWSYERFRNASSIMRRKIFESKMPTYHLDLRLRIHFALHHFQQFEKPSIGFSDLLQIFYVFCTIRASSPSQTQTLTHTHETKSEKVKASWRCDVLFFLSRMLCVVQKLLQYSFYIASSQIELEKDLCT